MTSRSLAERYARALLEVAEARHLEVRIAEELTGLGPSLGQGAPLIRFLESPQIATADKLTVLRSTIGARCAAPLLHFLCLVVERFRVGHLPMMIEEYQRLFNLDRGVQQVLASAARSLTEAERGQLTTRLETLTGRTVALVVEVNEGLLAGVVLRLGHRIVDGSLRRRLQELAITLRPSGVLHAA